ncbi:Lrp/AsnC family leucine-responsive transcriptional regulator [Aestuariispira insulae]|uniref:Lrp/AsnC family leucine-responsive transcriptional regulator n=2 Tax=Aestuariispira insulae TaxID=1461337 RepID=A0A3D9HXE4_9PROT|nr:Lrp/AsnC family leucine-responsive transcriptional regulator [Aestuariispira insulae]
MFTTTLEPQDLRLLNALQENARATNVELSEAVNLSPSQCYRRLKRLEEKGYIKRYAAQLSRRAVGLDVMAFVSVTLEKHGEDPARAFNSAVQRFPEILECWAVSGESDYLLRVVSTDLRTFSNFLMRDLLGLPMVSGVKSTILLEEEKSTTAYPLGHLAGKR